MNSFLSPGGGRIALTSMPDSVNHFPLQRQGFAVQRMNELMGRKRNSLGRRLRFANWMIRTWCLSVFHFNTHERWENMRYILN